MEGIMIKEAAKMLEVETHVLRYWEEELGLEIKRNSMGHRYYDERDIKLFRDVKELKKRGLTLKDIKSGIDNKKKVEMIRNNRDILKSSEEKNIEVEQPMDDIGDIIDNNPEENHKLEYKEENSEDKKIVDFKMAQMQATMNKIMANALRENKDIITSSIKAEITADVMRQFDTVMREKEEKEEARFKKLDECLRQIQVANAEVAATKSKKWFGRRK